MARILVVDDSASIRMALGDVLEDENHHVDTASDGKEALELISKGEYDLVISDIWMPTMNGLELLEETRKLRGDVGFIIITANPSVETAQKAFRAGAFDYVMKEALLSDTLASVRRSMERLELRRENRLLHEALHEKYAFDRILGKSPQMERVFETMRKILATETTVLVLGETGSGKELVAKAIHFNGKRRKGPYVAVNCAAISPNLLESELFGHERGAFTGAVASKRGLFEVASGGTIFLDEVSEMVKDLQSKLLRALQEREIQRIGSTRPRKIDVRVIAATNRDLQGEVEGGRFRPDLYYRLNVVPINLPPLRDREGDIPYLAKHFLTVHCARNGVPAKQLDSSALTALASHPWPGNVRELENVIERAVSLWEATTITAETFSHLDRNAGGTSGGGQSTSGATAADSSLPPEERFPSLADAERGHIQSVLDACEGNKSRAAKILKIDYSTLYRKLKRMGVE